MAQAYFPGAPAVASPSPLKQSFMEDKQLRVDDVQEAYIQQKDKWVFEISYQNYAKPRLGW
jgi:hypothetical protein